MLPNIQKRSRRGRNKVDESIRLGEVEDAKK